MKTRRIALSALLLSAVLGGVYYFWFARPDGGLFDADAPLPKPGVQGQVVMPPVSRPFGGQAELEAPDVSEGPDASRNPAGPAGLAGSADPAEDSMFPMRFVADAAAFVVHSYRPPNQAGDPAMPRMSWQRLNSRYGLDVSAFGHQSESLTGARREIFGHLFSRPVLEMLARIYRQPFLEELDAGLESRAFLLRDEDGVRERTLNQAECREFYGRAAAFVRGGAGVLGAYAKHAELRTLWAGYHQAKQAVLQAYADYASLETDGAIRRSGQGIQRAIHEREDLRELAIARTRELAGGLPAVTTDADVLYLAEWAARRLSEDPERAEALEALADEMEALARDMEAKAQAKVQGGAKGEV